MTGWILGSSTRHIPDDELHAYLDQALSRSQCVEIECHLAECRACARERDLVAAIRDRTTALLADLGPSRPLQVPPFVHLVARHQAGVARRHEALRRAGRLTAAAAVLALAMGAGWWSRGLFEAPAIASFATPTPIGERTLVALSPADTVRPTEPAADAPVAPAPSGRDEPVMADPPARLVHTVAEGPSPLAMQVTSLAGGDDGTVALAGLWQSVDWYEAWTLTGGNVPRIDGLPVLDVQLQRASDEARPVIVVAQQHPSGRVIRTIEGPFEQVAALVEHAGADLNASAASFTPPDYLADSSGVARRGLRILTVTGGLPADTLNALARNIALKE